ncbi:MAG: hypothetical protein AB1640_24075 [bacterium]
MAQLLLEHALIDGHDLRAILGALEAFPGRKGPTVIIANTVKSKGVPAVEGTGRAHFTSLAGHEVEAALPGLDPAAIFCLDSESTRSSPKQKPSNWDFAGPAVSA